MSRIIRCDKGHYYDADKFSGCPHCGVDISKRKELIEKSSMVEDLDNMVTVAKHVFAGSSRKRKKPQVTGKIVKPPREKLAGQITEEMRKVQELAALQQQNMQSEDQKTVRFELPESGIDPVVGWLVCTSGKQKGKDYRLRSGFNRIGRDRSMEIVLSDDRTVSRDTHCSVVYDGKSNETFLVPGKGTLTYLKGEIVRKATKLSTGEELIIGENTYVIICFCEGERAWREK